MMQLEDLVNWRNHYLVNFWRWYTYQGVYTGLSKSRASAFFVAVLDREWRVQEYEG